MPDIGQEKGVSELVRTYQTAGPPINKIISPRRVHFSQRKGQVKRVMKQGHMVH